MTNRRTRRAPSGLAVALALLTACLSLGLGLTGESHAQVSALPIDFDDVVIFATNSARLAHHVNVVAGHVVVNNASPGPTLSGGVELDIDRNVTTPTGYVIVGNRIDVANFAVVNGNAYYNTLSNSGTINGSLNTPLALPVFAPLPPFQTAAPGTLDVTVPHHQVQTLTPGSYRDIVVNEFATLKFNGAGVYNVRSLSTDRNVKLLFQNLGSGKAEVRVQNQVLVGRFNVVGPEDGDPLKASKIIFYVGFTSGPALTPAAFSVANDTDLKANVYAPNGRLTLDHHVTATGAFLARDVSVDNNAVVNLETAFGQVAPTITSANATTFTVGQAGTFTVTTTGTPTPSITRGGVALPSGVTFVDNGDGTGTLSGTPGAGTGGTYAITFTANNGVPPNAVQNFTLTVNQAPTITSANATTFTVGTAGSFTVTTTGFPTPSIARGGVVLPSGVTFVDNGNGTGTLSGIPAAGTGGIYAITFTATNAAGSSPVQNFTLTVNQAPAFTSAATTTFTVGQAGSFTVTATGFPQSMTITQGGALPLGVSYLDNGNGTGTLSGTPAAGTGGSYPLTFTANNGVAPNAVQNFTLIVNQAPAITSANSTTFNIGVPNTFSVTTTGFPTPGIAQGGALPSGVGFVDNGNGTGTLSGTPGPGTAGNHPLTFTASNGVPPNAVQNFTLTVLCPAVTVNPAGPALPDGTFGVAYSQTFTATGGTAPYSFAITAGAAPGGLTLASGGTLSGSPTNTGNFGFTVTATDAFGCTGANSYTIFVRPNAQPDTYANGVGNTQFVVGAAAPGTPHVFVSGNVLANDGGPAPLSASPASITTTNGGSVAMNANGTFTYTPAVGFAGPSDTFNYTLTDGNGGTATGTVTINLSDVVWYVDNTYAGANGASDGRSHRPFTTLSAADAPSLANQYIFVHQGSGNTSGGIVLDPGQTLWGQGATFTLHGLTIAATSRPTVTGTIVLNTNVTVRALDVSSGASTGISDPVGAITGIALSEVSVTTTTATAVLLSDAAGTLSFTSVSANGAVNGIALTNTTGSFAVTGDGGGANNGSGGTIQNTTGDGVALTNSQNVSLDQMSIQSTGGSGVNGTQVTNFSFTNGTIANAGNAGFESAIAFNGSGTGLGNNVAGTLTVTGNVFTNPFYSGLDVQSNNGTVTSASLSNNTISNPGFSGINLVGTGNASTSFSVNGATINQNNISSSGGNGVQVSIGNSNAAGPGATAGIPNDASNIIAITNNSISLDGTGTQAITVANSGGNSASRTRTNFLIECNGKNTGGCTAPTAAPITGSLIGTTVLVGNNGYATMVGTINNNVIDSNHTPDAGGGNGIIGANGVAGAGNAWTPDLTLTVTNNVITDTDGNGILLVGRGTSGTAKLRVANNNVAAPLGGARPGIRVDAGNGSSADDSICLDISGNVSAGSGGSLGIGLRKQGTNATINDFGIEGLLVTSSPGVELFVDGQNPAGGGTVLISATSGFSNCSTAP